MFAYPFLTFITMMILFPIYWLFITSVKHQKDWTAWPPVFIPTEYTFMNFAKLLSSDQVQLAIKNTVIVSFGSTFFSVFLGAIAAYSLVKIRLGRKKINNTLLTGILLSRLFPFISLLIPYFMLITNMRLMDTLSALILTNTAMFFPFVVWMMIGFYQGIPEEIEQSAMIDGCNLWQRLTKIVLPISITGLAVTSIFVFIASWNEFLYAITFSSQQAKTLPVMIGSFVTDKGILWGEMTALSVISILPVLILAVIAQKYLVRGITIGAVK